MPSAPSAAAPSSAPPVPRPPEEERGLLASLREERDALLASLQQAMGRVQCLTEESAQQQQRHDAQRQRDQQTFGQNLERLLEEKARLLEEVEIMQTQKDQTTERLVEAHQQLSVQQRLAEEAGTWRQQHAEAVEALQRALAEAQSGREAQHGAAVRLRAVETERDAANTLLVAQEASAREQSRRLDESRELLEAGVAELQAADAARRRLVVEAHAVTAALAEAEGAFEQLAQQLAAAQEAAACGALAQRRAEEDAASATKVAEARARDAEGASLALANEREAAAAAARDAREAAAALTAERNAAVDDAAAQRRVADSLKLELKKVMARQARQGGGAPAAAET